MAGEIQAAIGLTGKTIYAQIRNRIGQIWNTSTVAFEAYLTANIANYAISATEQGSSGYYIATFPSAITAGVYSVILRQQIGGSVAESDPNSASGDLQWNGTVTMPLSDTATSGQIGQIAPIRLARGTMIQNFPFKLVSAADHITPFTSGVVSGQISRDGGGTFGALQSGAFTETGLGWYTLQALTSGDLLANTAALVFTANGISGGASDPRDIALVLQRVSGV